MGDALIGLGVLLAILGPVLLVPAVWLVHRLLTLPAVRALGLDSTTGARGAWLASTTLVLGSVLITHLVGKVEFDRRCQEAGEPVIHRRVRVSGFFQSPLFSYQALEILRTGPFEFVEGERPRIPGYTRYSLDQEGRLQEEKVTERIAAYGLREELESTRWGTTIQTKTAYEMASGQEIGRAANLTYSGGPLSVFLGAYGMASCPDPASPDGSEAFRIYYDFAALVLGGGV